ncbi:MAG: carboxymuconolactone decarboxylase family protein [Desulfovibrionaceae bacterium]|nr:carboxymuconolactone decarboxylase family protein [Desulfovibrionaceae bacterium]
MAADTGLSYVQIFSLAVLTVLFLMGNAASALAAQSEHNNGVQAMDRSPAMEKNRQKFLGNTPNALAKTDPDFAAMRDRLVYGEIVDRGTLDDRQRMLITLVTLATSHTLDDLKTYTEAALRVGVSPVEIKESLYQCAPYIGFPKTESAVRLANEAFIEKGISLPVESQATVTEASRFKSGLAVQKAIFGDIIDKMHASAPEGQKDIIVNHLSAFCFGDIYTRKGLDLKTRELLTFAITSALGGCEAQVKAHVQGNANMGNSKQNLIDALAQMLPYIGFPRTLNALACVNTVMQGS